MRRAVLADTGPLYAAADPDDAHHQRAHRELRRITRDKREVIVAYPTLAEAYTLILYRLGKEAASSWLNDVRNGVALVNPTPEDYQEAMQKLLAFPDQPITLFDATPCCVVAWVPRCGPMIITSTSCGLRFGGEGSLESALAFL